MNKLQRLEADFIKLNLAALLHDVGKVGVRGGRFPSEEAREKYAVKRKYIHSANTFEFFNECEKFKVLTGKTIEEGVWEEIADLASSHHRSDMEGAIRFLEILRKADRLSASERHPDLEEEEEKMQEEAERMYRKRPLLSVFELINLEDEVDLSEIKSEKGLHVYLPEVFNVQNVSQVIFPSKWDVERELGKEYEDLLAKFKEDFEKLNSFFTGSLSNSQSPNSFLPHQHRYPRVDIYPFYINALLRLLEKYFTFVPSFTQRICDISLYDHLRTTAMIVSCLYYHSKEPEFLMINGDIAGIQKFIYNLASPGGIGGTAKILRGKSFRIAILAEALARFLVNELNLTNANILYVGGGKFDIVAPDTLEVRDRLREFQSKVNKTLLDKYQGEISLILSWVSFKEKEMKELHKVMKRINEKVLLNKKKRFENELKNNCEFEMRELHCKACGKFDIKENELCENCLRDKEIGTKIGRDEIVSVAFLKNSDTVSFPDAEEIWDLGNIGKVVGLNKDEYKKWSESPSFNGIIDMFEVFFPFFVESYSPIGAKSLGILTARAEKEIEKERKEERVDKGGVLPFQYIAEIGRGDKKLGFLRMDVDNLGTIFALGLRMKYKGEYVLSPSRIATLSRFLDIFFSRYLGELLREEGKKYVEEIKRLTKEKNRIIKLPTEEEIKGDSPFYVVYSGGDDIFIVGQWDAVIQIAQKIREDFAKFTCYNRFMGISGGLVITKPAFPVAEGAELAGREESEAKKGDRKDGREKDRLSIFKTPTTWEVLKRQIGFSDKIVEWLKPQSPKIGRRLIHLLLRMCYSHRFISYGDKIDTRIYPYIFYIVGRNAKDEAKEEIIKWIVNDEKAEENLLYFHIALQRALLLTRR